MRRIRNSSTPIEAMAAAGATNRRGSPRPASAAAASSTTSNRNASGLAARVRSVRHANTQRRSCCNDQRERKARAIPSMNGYAAETTSKAQTSANARIVHRLCNSHSWRTTAAKPITATVTVRTASSLMPIAAAIG